MSCDHLKIYIAGPYTADTEFLRVRNVNAAIDVAFQLFSKGHYPYIPHLTHFIDLRANEIGRFLTWEDYIKWDLPWIEVCDALLYLSPSRGADLELERARLLGRQVFYSVDEVPEVSGDRPPQGQKHSEVLS
jgi:hypothetical protein